MNVRNIKTGAVHQYGPDFNSTACGVDVTNKDRFEATHSTATCARCEYEMANPMPMDDAPVRVLAGEDSDSIDPLGVLDDDLPDGAYWAMHYEVYGW